MDNCQRLKNRKLQLHVNLPSLEATRLLASFSLKHAAGRLLRSLTLNRGWDGLVGSSMLVPMPYDLSAVL